MSCYFTASQSGSSIENPSLDTPVKPEYDETKKSSFPDLIGESIFSSEGCRHDRKITMNYQMDTKGDALILRTTSFRAEKGSFLHVGIFNREFMSSIAAGAALILLAFLLRSHAQITLIYFIIGAFLFAGIFMVFRIYIFQEPVLETDFDKGRRIISISMKGIGSGRTKSYPMNELGDITLNRVTLQPQNIDGIKVVEKIALQHGTVIPGFGQKREFYAVMLDFKGRSFSIFSSEDNRDAEEIVARIKDFLA